MGRRRIVPLVVIASLAVAACSSGGGREPPAPAARAGIVGVGAPIAGWSPSDVAIVDPRDHGAAGDGIADDTDAVLASLFALRDGGGILLVADGVTLRTSDVVSIPGDHVKWWSPGGTGEVLTAVGSRSRAQAIICRDRAGCGFFGVRFRSDAVARLDALEDSMLAIDGGRLTEVVGVEISGSASAAVFFFGASRESYVAGNHVHRSHADAIHFTDGSRRAWVWDNTIDNRGTPGGGDDGVACVTYGNGDRCGEMEWWGNRHLGGGWGRGYSVVGGERISIHDNFARHTAAAGVLVAAEPTYDTPGSEDIEIADNVLYATSQVVPHPGILISGLSGRISRVAVRDNVVVDPASGEVFRTEGDVADVTDTGTRSSSSDLPDPLPDELDGPLRRDASVLRTRDLGLVPVADGTRDGLHRLHLRLGDAGPEQRFEYVVAGPPGAVDAWLDGHRPEARVDHDGESVVVVLSARPVAVPATLRSVGFEEVRAGDRSGALAALWAAIDR